MIDCMACDDLATEVLYPKYLFCDMEEGSRSRSSSLKSESGKKKRKEDKVLNPNDQSSTFQWNQMNLRSTEHLQSFFDLKKDHISKNRDEFIKEQLNQDWEKSVESLIEAAEGWERLVEISSKCRSFMTSTHFCSQLWMGICM